MGRIAAIAFGMLAGLALVGFGMAVSPRPVFADRTAASPGALPGGTGGLIAVGVQLASGGQQVTVIDSATRVMSVYHIDPSSGKIALRSVRKIRWDLEMDEYNGAKPLPEEIRSAVEQK